MRTVVNSSQVAHLWANQSQARAHNSGHSVSFQGRDFYSYRTRIASLVTDENGATVVLVTCEKYSMTTTSRHMPEVWRAVRHLPSYSVPNLDGTPSGHAANVEYLVRKYRERVQSMLRAQSRPWGDVREYLSDDVREISEYATRFGITAPALDTDADAAAIEARFARLDAKRADPKYQAKLQRARDRREAKTAAELQFSQDWRAAHQEEFARRFPEAVAVFPAWREGKASDYEIGRMIENDRSAYRAMIERRERPERIAAWRSHNPLAHVPYDIAPLLRLSKDGKDVQTSQGASVPVAHARRLFGFVARCRAEGREFVPNGHTEHVGAFTVAHVAPNGDLRVGCHSFEWAEIERFAHAMGWGYPGAPEPGLYDENGSLAAEGAAV